MDVLSRRLWGKFVSSGYFPEELPACFSSVDLEYIVRRGNFNLSSFLQGDDRVPSSSKLLPFSIPHTKGYRRNLTVPGPFHYLQLTQALVQHRSELEEIHKLSELSIYEDYNDDNHRYIAKPDFKKFIDERILRSSGYRYLLNVDVTRFYASIYTHSIPWAIHGKTIAKANNRNSLYGNFIDMLVRNCQDKQTLGLPIGPDSSRIISELILAKVDEELQNEISDFKGIRNVDDYFLFFKSHGDAEKGRSVLQRLLRAYELELNEAKERILELPDILESEWKARIRSFKFRRDDGQQRFDLIAFFDMVFSFARSCPADMVLPYAVAKLRSLRVARSNWQIFQAFLLNSIVLEPKVVVQVVNLLLKTNSSAPRRIQKAIIKEAFDSFISYHATHDNHFEVVWALWFYYQVKYELSETLVRQLNSCENDFVILILLALEREGLTELSFDKARWRSLVTSANLYSEHWLIAYEGVAGTWLRRSQTSVQNDKFFEQLLLNDVTFFKPNEEDDDSDGIDGQGTSLSREVEAEDEDTDEDQDEDETQEFEPTEDQPF
ncbi:RNA-directed DNA polymerase [Niabella sp. CJ426]|uniref:RNA-directed DNA polymerase n=1 Tax=Niabella sp. CJ426 TaxID=3393740 RepID=UPI003D094949